MESLGSEVDYNIYYNTVEGDRHAMEEKALGLRDLNSGIPLDHVVQFVRDYKCFDTEVIQVIWNTLYISRSYPRLGFSVHF